MHIECGGQAHEAQFLLRAKSQDVVVLGLDASDMVSVGRFPGWGLRWIYASDQSESRFSVYVEGIVEANGHTDRVAPLRAQER